MNGAQRQRLLLVIAGVALGLLAGEKLVLVPLTESWKARSALIADLRRKATDGELLVGRDRAIRERWSMMRTNSFARDASVAQNQVLKAFDRWSRESGVGVISIRPQTRQTDEDYATIECRADAFGDLRSLTRFLYLIEADPLAVKVESMEISARDGNLNQLNLILQVSALIIQPPGS
jgi:hypothetical protein